MWAYEILTAVNIINCVYNLYKICQLVQTPIITSVHTYLQCYRNLKVPKVRVTLLSNGKNYRDEIRDTCGRSCLPVAWQNVVL